MLYGVIFSFTFPDTLKDKNKKNYLWEQLWLYKKVYLQWHSLHLKLKLHLIVFLPQETVSLSLFLTLLKWGQKLLMRPRTWSINNCWEINTVWFVHWRFNNASYLRFLITLPAGIIEFSLHVHHWGFKYFYLLHQGLVLLLQQNCNQIDLEGNTVFTIKCLLHFPLLRMKVYQSVFRTMLRTKTIVDSW